MYGAIRPLPHMPSWHAQGHFCFTFTLFLALEMAASLRIW
jgi:hypothetical protein